MVGLRPGYVARRISPLTRRPRLIFSLDAERVTPALAAEIKPRWRDREAATGCRGSRFIRALATVH
jgi:hypothetical protein